MPSEASQRVRNRQAERDRENRPAGPPPPPRSALKDTSRTYVSRASVGDLRDPAAHAHYPRRAERRSTSSIFAMFSQGEIQEMKEDKKKEKKSKKKEKVEEAAPAANDAGGDSPAPTEPKRAQRATSNVFALFNQAQIQEFKEAFTLMDQNRDGFIDLDDLGGIFDTLGREPKQETIDAMLAEAPGQLNFTHFLTLFGEKLHGREPEHKTLENMLNEAPGPLNFTMFLNLFGDKMKGTDPERTLLDAFKMFDPEGKGYLEEEYVRDLLMNTGDQFSKDEIKQTWKECPVEAGKIDYTKFVHIIKRGNQDE